MSAALIPVNRDRVQHRIERLAALTEPDRPFTRRAFTELYLEARDWLASEFRAAGLEPSVDAGGNLVGRRAGADAALAPLSAGSHTDTVAGGGRFDGVAGVISALEAAQALHEHGAELRHPLWIFDFLSEEPSDYGASCVGSRALVGTLTADMLAATNPSGESLRDAIARMGGGPKELEQAIVRPSGLAAYLELHIEQGPVLERAGDTIGLVEGIVSIGRATVEFRGQAAHAGTTPMNLRHDALVGAARLADDVWTRAQALAASEAFVATIGRFDVLPNGANVVPGEVRLTVEARSLDDGRVKEFLQETARVAESTARSLALEVEVRPISNAPASRSDPRLLAALEHGCVQRKHAFRRMSSGAGHDAMQVARVAPMAMLFIPCEAGLSHNPAEQAAYDDVAAGAEVLVDALLELDRAL